jgi:hypothetical protein
MLMCRHDHAVDHQYFQIAVVPDGIDDALPYTRLAPALESRGVAYQLPNSNGKSRHPEPVHMIHSIASINSRVKKSPRQINDGGLFSYVYNFVSG